MSPSRGGVACGEDRDLGRKAKLRNFTGKQDAVVGRTARSRSGRQDERRFP